MHEKRGFEALAFLALAGLCAWLVRCLTANQKQTMDSITTASSTISKEATAQMASMTRAFSTATSEVTGKVSGLAETLILGRDLPSQNGNSLTSSTEPESWSEPEIELSDLPETAQWAAEEENLLRTETLEPSWSPPNDLD